MTKPASFKVATVKALSAAHAAGFTHFGPGPFTNYDWAVDGHCYHAVERRNPRGGKPTVRHACRSLRALLTDQLRCLPVMSDRHTLVMLGLGCPSWPVCAQDGPWLPCSDADAAIAQIYQHSDLGGQMDLLGAVL